MMIRKFIRLMSSKDLPILITHKNKSVEVVLNRPKALNALNLDMIQMWLPELQKWDNSDIRVVTVRGIGDKAFCAGGDIRSLYDAKVTGTNNNILSDFFWFEYQLDYALAIMNPIQVSIWNGIVMGGGCGISMNSSHIVATQNSVLAMPETAIGFFPDVGGSYFLSKLPNGIGLYMGLTGARIQGEDLVRLGLANCYVDQEKLNLLEVIVHNETNEFSNRQKYSEKISKFCQKIDKPYKFIEQIKEHFENAKSVEEIFESLKSKQEKCSWCEQTLKSLNSVSPLSLKVVFEQLLRGKQLPLKDAFSMEYRMSQHFMKGADFFEGVRAFLVDKDKKPKWKHSSVKEVTKDEYMEYFEPVEKELIL